MFKFFTNYNIIRKSKRIVEKSCQDQILSQQILEIIICSNAAFSNLQNIKKRLIKNFDKSWKLERAYILYFITEKIISCQWYYLNFEFRSALEDAMLDWIVEVYEQTYDKKMMNFCGDL